MSWQHRAQQAIVEIKSAKTENASLQAFLNLDQVWMKVLKLRFARRWFA